MFVSLIGMPGGGKSTVGRLLARRLGVPFSDSDAVIERQIGCSIRDFFEAEGEERFRDIEQDVIAELVRADAERLPDVLGWFAAWWRRQGGEFVAKAGHPVGLEFARAQQLDGDPATAGLRCFRQVDRRRTTLAEWGENQVGPDPGRQVMLVRHHPKDRLCPRLRIFRTQAHPRRNHHEVDADNRRAGTVR